MAEITLKGNTIHTIGQLPPTNSKAPNFIVTKTDLSELQYKDLAGKNIVLNIFPSLDTPTCAHSVRKFNERAAKLGNTVVLCVSKDLPFAQSRFCTTEKINNVIPVSAFRHSEFGERYGVTIVDGPLAGLLARAIVVIDKSGNVLYTEQVKEIAEEPNYEAALRAVPLQ